MDSIVPSNIPQKQCTGPCGQILPATTEFFYSHRTCKDGLLGKCKSCVKARGKARQIRLKARTDTEINASRSAEKQCPACQNVFPSTTDFFNSNKTNKDGLHYLCKTCDRKRQNEYYYIPEVHEKTLAQQKDYNDRPEIRERRLIRQREYYYRPEIHEDRLAKRKLHYQQNREQILLEQRSYRDHPENRKRKHVRDKAYRDHPENRKRYQAWLKDYRNRPEARKRLQSYHHVYHKEYMSRPGIYERRQAQYKAYMSSPEGRTRSNIRKHNYRARKGSIPGTHTIQQIQEMLKRQRYRCYYCSSKFKRVKGKYIYDIEHTFPISRVAGTAIPANDISYLVLACPQCNQSKNNKFPWEWPEGGRLL